MNAVPLALIPAAPRNVQGEPVTGAYANARLPVPTEGVSKPGSPSSGGPAMVTSLTNAVLSPPYGSRPAMVSVWNPVATEKRLVRYSA